MLWMFICNVFLDERGSFEEFLTRFAPELAFIFLFNKLFNCL